MKKKTFIISLLLLLAAGAGLMELTNMGLFKERTVEQYEMHLPQEHVSNPLIGFAPSAGNLSLAAEHSLVYVDITWRELEPEEGVFDFASIEKKNHWKRWREEGKHVVLRFVLDVPRSMEHMDIPDWLYEKTEGEFYDHSYGKGYSPDYADPVLITAHEKAIQALGERYGADTFVSYVQLGSLGHWGEWHVNLGSGMQPLPEESIRDQYVLPYLSAFPHAKLLMRRPFGIAEEKGLGLYNDMAGHQQGTNQWLGWIEQGGSFEQTGEESALVPMAGAWKRAPMGGEFTSAIPMSQLLTTNLSRTLQMLRDSHMSFLGPKVPIADPAHQQEITQVLQTLGYQIGITKMTWTERFGKVQVKLMWENHGVAPMYWDWPVKLYMLDGAENQLAAVPVEIALTALLPGKKVKTTTSFSLPENAEAVSIGIEDPMTGEPAVQLFSNQEKSGRLHLVKRLRDE